MSRHIADSDYAVISGVLNGRSNNALSDDGAPLKMDIFNFVSLQMSGSFSGVVLFEVSFDGEAWEHFYMLGVDGIVSDYEWGNKGYTAFVPFPYFRVRCTEYYSGTKQITAKLSTVYAPHMIGIRQLPVLGTSDHGGSDYNGPIKIGGRADAYDRAPVVNGKRVDARYDLLGKTVVVPQGVRAQIARGNCVLNSTTETTLLTAVSGAFVDISWLSLTNTSGSIVHVFLRESTGGTAVHVIAVPGNATVLLNCNELPLIQTAQNNNWTLQLSGAISSLYCLAQGIIRAV